MPATGPNESSVIAGRRRDRRGADMVCLAQPIPVDLATVAKGPMEVTVDDEGRTRVRHVYTVSAPVAGKVLRISHPSASRAVAHVGDQVTANETVVALMQPTLPSFHRRAFA